MSSMDALRGIEQAVVNLQQQIDDLAASDMDPTQKMMKMQNLYLQMQQVMQMEQQIYQAISTIMKARHDSATNAIRNIR
jgi:hypothetical protein